MSFSYSAITNRGRVTLPSVESWGTDMNIMKDPVKSIMLRRRDKVGDNMDIIKDIDNSDRAGDAILRFARGVNPMVSVSYGNATNNQQVRLPYVINKDGDFHPPVVAPQDLLPLSRMPRNVTSAITNPTMPDTSKQLDNSRNVTVLSSTKSEIISAQVRPTRSYSLQKPFQEAYDVKNSIQRVLHKSANVMKTLNADPNMKYNIKPTKVIIDDNLNVFALSNRSNPSVNVYGTNNLDTNRFLQDNINTQAFSNKASNSFNYSQNDQQFDLENGQLHEDIINIDISSNPTSYSKTNYIHENFELDRNLPNYSSRSNIRSKTEQTRTYIHDDVELERTLPEYSSQTNIKGRENGKTYIHDDIFLNRNMPEYSATSNITSKEKHVSFINDDIELERNLPIYNSQTNVVGHKDIAYIHEDIDLEKNLPYYKFDTNARYNLQKIHKPEHVRERDRKTVLGQYSVNQSGNGDTNIGSTQYNLLPKITVGGMEGRESKPTFDRMQNVNEEYETDKSKMQRLVNESFTGRFGTPMVMG